ncbi:exosortase F system-associated protein [Flavobacterium sp. WV_118_3]|uniref:exosortase F system-associated membrane protein n=1 Tax=Flavobacterium sp. WV_118_3 TaxID=3151764 RepID=UPI0012D27DD1|nr:exosortase F system-associated protein [Flavobacterium sp.]
MLQNVWKNKQTILGIVLAVMLLAVIRAFENQLFYDPFLAFFRGTFQNAVLPTYETGRLIISLSLRYWLNTAISLGIIYIVFREKSLLQLSGLLYVFFYIGLLTAFVIVLKSSDKPDYMTLFYIRRFLIQPLLLLLFLPAFYYQKKKS